MSTQLFVYLLMLKYKYNRWTGLIGRRFSGMPMNSMGLIMFPKVTELLYKRRVQPQSPPGFIKSLSLSLSFIDLNHLRRVDSLNSNKYQGLMMVNDLHQQFTFLQISLLTAPLPFKQQGSTNLIIPSNEMGSMIVMRSSLRLLFIKEVHL